MKKGIWQPVFKPFEVDNKGRHIKGVYHGIGTTCPDGKISRVNTKWLGKLNGLPDDQCDAALFDILNFVGASKGFVDPAFRSSSLDQLEFLVIRHKIERYTIVDHDQCGAYRDELENSPLRDNEELFHIHKLQEARWIIGKRLPELDVILVYSSRIGEQIRFKQVPPG